MDELAREMEEARAHLGVRWPEERATEVAQALEGLRRRRVALQAAAAGVFTLLALVAGVVGWRHSAVVALPHGPVDRTIRFTDGSAATPLAADTVLRTTGGPAYRVIEIERGSARFDIVHDPGRTFVVDAGEVRVEDLGTRFVVERIGRRARVSVEYGRVKVAWGAGHQELGAGQSELFPPESPAPASLPAAEPSPTSAPSRHGASLQNGGRGWKLLAEEGDFDRAYEQLPRSSELRDSPDDLLSAADVARLSHHPADAVEPLRRVIREHARDPRAPLAGFTLGRILLEQLGRPGEAAEAFAGMQTLAPDGPLVPDALAREVEAWSRAGDPEHARIRAEDYLRRFPDGNRVRSVRRYGGLD